MSYSDELARQLFFLTAAGLGAVFAVLYPVTAAVADGTYDENDNVGYVSKIVVGLISGTILGQLIDVGSFGELGDLSQPTLALLGGFSSSLVFIVLTRLVRGIESVFSDSSPQNIDRSAAANATPARANAVIAAERQVIVAELATIQATHAAPGSPLFQAITLLIRRILRGEVSL